MEHLHIFFGGKMKFCVFVSYFCACCFAVEIRNYRLSTDVVPSHYSIKIQPDIDNDVFYGDVSIYVRTRTIIDKITLHAAQLNITHAFINNIECIFEDEENEKVSFHYKNDDIQPGEHFLRIKYVGILQKKGTGFLKAPYKYREEEGFILVTDFEPTGARKAFPCFDEPSFKAKYNIRLIAPHHTYRAISNMPVINEFVSTNGIINEFATSIPMSTYLVSFGLTKYSYYEDYFKDGDRNVPIRIYTFNASVENNGYAMNCTKRALQFYSEYTNIRYPLSKLDMIEYVRPETAATENWGLITFREGLLSLNLEIYDEMQIKVVIYHEISHFWFGNLVTNDWWNDIWLQEGFATYMSFKLYTTDLEVRQDRISFFFDGFFEIDNILPTRPIVEYLPTHEHIKKRFDSTIYNKGAAILFMIEGIIGNDAFQNATQNFLTKYAYRTATTNDFISAIEEVVPHLSVRGFIESYLYQNRFPIINVDAENGTFIMKQQICSTVANFSDSRQKWTIPITYITDKSKEPMFVLFDKDMDSLSITVPGANWILLNSKGTGIYKVLYSERQWESLTKHFQEFSPVESNTLISDALYYYKFGLANCDVVLKLMKQVNDKKQWSSFAEFHLLLEENLRCNNYDDELTAYLKFLTSRFVATDYPKRPKAKRGTCSNGDSIFAIKNDKEALQKCAKWIKENLPESIINLTETRSKQGWRGQATQTQNRTLSPLNLPCRYLATLKFLFSNFMYLPNIILQTTLPPFLFFKHIYVFACVFDTV